MRSVTAGASPANSTGDYSVVALLRKDGTRVEVVVSGRSGGDRRSGLSARMIRDGDDSFQRERLSTMPPRCPDWLPNRVYCSNGELATALSATLCYRAFAE